MAREGVEGSSVQRAREAASLLLMLFEAAVTAEIVWYYLHDGNQTLHEAAREWGRMLTTRARHHVSVARALSMIRSLPETQRKQRK